MNPSTRETEADQPGLHSKFFQDSQNLARKPCLRKIKAKATTKKEREREREGGYPILHLKA